MVNFAIEMGAGFVIGYVFSGIVYILSVHVLK